MIKHDLAKFNQIFTKAAIATLKAQGEVFQEQLTEERRNFPHPTVREYGRGKTGKYAGSPRDVVDSGELVDSYKLTVNKSLHQIEGTYSYSADHAERQYTGWITNRGEYVEPYPWIENGVREFEFEREFADRFNAES